MECISKNVKGNNSDILSNYSQDKSVTIRDDIKEFLKKNSGGYPKKDIVSFNGEEYEVRVSKEITSDFLKSLERGVKLTEINKKTKPCKTHRYGHELYRFSITITEGLNRQVRRMCKELGYHVVDLKRIRIMNYKLGNLKTGEFKIIKVEDIF